MIDLDGDLYAEAEGEGHGGDDEEEREKGEEESTAARTLGIRFKWTIVKSLKVKVALNLEKVTDEESLDLQ